MGFCRDADESNHIRGWRLGSEWTVVDQCNELAAVADGDIGVERQLSEEFSAELCTRAWLPNDKSTRSPDVHDIIGAKFLCEDARAKRPVSTNVYASEENDESHIGILK